MAVGQVTCIKKDDRQHAYERITWLAGPDWGASQKQVIAWIDNKVHQFYVKRPTGDRVWLVTAVSRFGNKYVKTERDGDEPNNLLSLPECR